MAPCCTHRRLPTHSHLPLLHRKAPMPTPTLPTSRRFRSNTCFMCTTTTHRSTRPFSTLVKRCSTSPYHRKNRCAGDDGPQRKRATPSVSSETSRKASSRSRQGLLSGTSSRRSSTGERSEAGGAGFDWRTGSWRRTVARAPAPLPLCRSQGVVSAPHDHRRLHRSTTMIDYRAGGPPRFHSHCSHHV